MSTTETIAIYHEMGHSIDKLEAGIGVDIYLEEGIYSRREYRKQQRLPPSWEDLRREALKDKPEILESVLRDYHPERGWGAGSTREELVFFGWKPIPSNQRDWVMIECDPKKTIVHDASCRDRRNPQSWTRDAVTLQEYMNYHESGQLPPRWESSYNEIVFVDHVEPKRIVAYSKIEKTIPMSSEDVDEEVFEIAKSKIESELNEFTHFEHGKNVFIVFNEKEMQIEIRVALNREKVMGNEHQVQSFFESFSSLEDLTPPPENTIVLS